MPAGLDDLTSAQEALAEWYGLSDALIAAAAQGCPSLPRNSPRSYAAWVAAQPPATKDAWLAQLLGDASSNVRRTMLAEFQKGRQASTWPNVRLGRTIGELELAAEDMAKETARKAEEAATRKRAKKLAQMAADPEASLRRIEELVPKRTRQAYAEIAALLADLREALARDKRAGFAEDHARQLERNNPTLRMLIPSFDGRDFFKRAGENEETGGTLAGHQDLPEIGGEPR